MNIGESVNRGLNLLAASIVSLAGFAFLPEVFVENDLADKIDDGLLFLLGLAAIWWYNRAHNRFMRTAVPVVLVAFGLLDKIGAVIIEWGDAESVGDDMGGVILFVIALGLVWYQYRKTKKMAWTTGIPAD